MKKLKPLALGCLTLMLPLLGSSCQTATEVSEVKELVYGPIPMVYELPEVSGTIFYAAPDGDPAAEGSILEAPTTIESAISRVSTGDAIVLRGGTYRTGDLTFNQGITIQPYRDEQPVLKGTLVAENWEQDEAGVWFTRWTTLFPGQPEAWWVPERNLEFTPLHRFNNDGIFINGAYLQSVGSIAELTPETYFVDYDAERIYLGSDPNGRLVEITAFRKAIFRTTAEVHGKQNDGKGPIIRGLDIQQYPDTMVHIDGYYPQGISAEHEHGTDVVGTVFENCSFTQCFRIGVFAIGNDMIMRNCRIEDTNTEGLYVVASNDVLLERNIFAHNNIEKWTGFFPAAVKIFNQSHRVTARENLITNHPNSNGLWYDVGNENGVFVNNRIEKVGSPEGPFRKDQVWPSSNGFFFEISSGVLVAGNTFVNNNQGLLILNSDDAEIYNNTFIDSRVAFGRNERGDDADHFGWHIRTGPAVDARENHVFVNNLMVQTRNYDWPMVHVWQPAAMCDRLTSPTLKAMNNNVYVKQSEGKQTPLLLWSPAASEENCQRSFMQPSDFTAVYHYFEANSRLFDNYNGPLLIKDQAISADFEGHQAATTLPDHVQAATGWSAAEPPFVGAR